MIYLIKTIDNSNYLFRHFSTYLFFFILGTFLPFTIYGQFAGGSGTTQDPYLIGNIQQLQAVSSVSNTAHFRLINDIDASQTATWNNGKGFEPISYQNGSLDGNNFIISNLVINRTNEDRAALIEHIGPNCTVKDLTLENVNIRGKTRTASLCGVLSGEIQNVFVSGTINGDDNSGGLAGEIYSGSNVSDCHTNANVMSSGSTVGGLIGYNNSAIVENCSSYGSVNGKNQVGGLIGKNEGDVISSQSAAVITGSGDNIGGLIGLNNGGDISHSFSEGEVNGKKNTGGLIGFNGYNGSTITNCHSTANVIGTIHVGGLVGFNQDGLIELCYSTGSVNGETETGGLVGYMAYGSSVISQCFSTSEVFGQHSNIGGLVGAIQSGTIVNSYAVGTASGNNKVGGLVGEIKWATISNSFSSTIVSSDGGQSGGLIASSTGGSVNNSFWDTETSGVSYSSGGTPQNTAQMNDINTFLNSGWNFTTIWSIDPTINNGYPFLSPLGGFYLIIWTGNIDIAWEVPGNWNQNIVPTANDNVRIPPVPNQPVISSDAKVKSITIQSNSVVTIAHNGSLTVSASLNNMAGPAGLFIQSNTNGTGSLLHNSPDVPATFERYINGEPETWHMLSSPVSNQPISGSFTPAGSYGDGTGYDFYTWYEPEICWIYLLNINYPPVWITANGSNNFVPGKGYLVSYQSQNPTLEFQGNLNNGMLTFEVTKTIADTAEAGSNLIGNPYPSSIDWKAESGWDRSPLISNGQGYDIWIWNDQAENYGVYNSASETDLGTLGVTRYIAPTQGFFVAAAETGSISMTNDIRIHDGSDNWLKTTSENAIRLSLTVQPVDGNNKDEIVIEFGHSDKISGSRKKFSFIETAPSLYIPVNGIAYSLHHYTTFVSTPVIPVSFKPGVDGSHVIKVNFDDTYFKMIILEDKKTENKHDFLSNPEYSFQASSTDNPERFVLHFVEGNFADPHDQLPVHIYSYDKTLYIDMRLVQGNTNYYLEIFDTTGRRVFAKTINDAVELNTIDLHSFNGVFIVRFSDNKNQFTKKIML